MNLQITTQQLAQIGIGQLAYLRPVLIDGDTCFAIHAADGTALAVAGDVDQALHAIVAHEMTPVSVH